MHKVSRGTLLVAACVLLMGCPKVSRVSGKVANQGKQLQVGDEPRPFTQVSVSGGSVTLSEGGCDVTYTESFTAPYKLGNCDRKDDDEQEQQQEQEQEQQEQPQDRQHGGQQGQDQAPPSNGGTSGTEAVSGIDAPAVAPTPAPGHSGLDGPPATATAGPTFTSGNVLNVAKIALEALGAVALGKEIHDQTDGNNGDEPLSR
jgi:hypothetical protein